jgi:DNA-binding transcriptional ArsR family regulator
LIRISLPTHPTEHVAVTVSPLLECALSLHVLLGPKHHALHHDWVRRMRRLPADLRRDIQAHGFVFRTHVPDVFLPTADGAAEDFAGELAAFRAQAPEDLRAALSRPLHDHGGDPERVLWDEDPVAFAESLADVLERYWVAAFEAEWERIEPVLARSISAAGRLLLISGVWPVLGRLPPQCRIDPAAGELVVDLPHEHSVAVSADNPLVLCPSVFVWPHLVVSCDPPWPLAVVYTAPEIAHGAEPRIPPTELLGVLRALADDTRLRILKLIAEQPRTTQELTTLVGLSRAGVSKCLQSLADAGLIAGRREGYYVVYSLAPERLAALGDGLAEFLGR